MNFSINSPVLFFLAGIIIAAVLAQSVYFLVKAWRRGLAIGMSKDKLKRVAMTAGTLQPNPITKGMNDLPCNPILCMILSMMKAALAM